MINIKMTEEVANQMAQDVLKTLMEKVKAGEHMFNSGASISIPLTKASQPNAVSVNFTATAYAKMRALVQHFSSEIGWSGLVNRLDETHFEIYDILVYPQTVTAATVNTDQAKYEAWRDSLDDEQFNHCRMQGHSHVNMGVTPSATDINDQKRLIDNLGRNDYYIILIWNKRDEYSIWVFDMAKNIMYEKGDICLTVDGFDTKGFLEDAEKMLEKVTYTVAYGTGANYGNYGRTGYTGYQYGSGNGANFQPEVKKEIKEEAVKKDEKPASKPVTATGAAAPKTDLKTLADYYHTHVGERIANGNSSCYPYDDDDYDYVGR